MCLVTGKKKPFKAPFDIQVTKWLETADFVGYFTPYAHMPCSVPGVLKPDHPVRRIPRQGNSLLVEDGWIHAYTGVHEPENQRHFACCRAVIPAGSKFFLSNDLREVAAEEMRLEKLCDHVEPSVSLNEFLASIAYPIRTHDLFKDDMSWEMMLRIDRRTLSICKYPFAPSPMSNREWAWVCERYPRIQASVWLKTGCVLNGVFVNDKGCYCTPTSIRAEHSQYDRYPSIHKFQANVC